MKTLFAFSLTLFFVVACGEAPSISDDLKIGNHKVDETLQNGVYKSTEKSYRQNFYFVISGETATLYGWEMNKGGLITYYRSTAKNKALSGPTAGEIDLKFEQFDYSTQAIMNDDVSGFVSDNKTSLLTIDLHRYFKGKMIDGKLVFKDVVKDSYMSRSDYFEFVKIK